MFACSTPLGSVEFDRGHLIWRPLRGPLQRVEIGETIVNSCLVPGPGGSTCGLVLFTRPGLILHLSLPSLVPLASTRLAAGPPNAAQIIFSHGIPYLVMAKENRLQVRALQRLSSTVACREFHKMADLLYLDDDELVVIHGMESTLLKVDELIPPP